MELKLIKKMEITDYENEIGYKIVVTERRNPSRGVKPYYAHFDGCEVSEGRILSSITGDGDTIDKAISDYAKRISCKTLVFGAFSSRRQEILSPKLVHTKLIEKREQKKKSKKRIKKSSK